MTDPTTNARPARKKRRWVTSTAAATLSAKPVIEIAFGVSRDSISRLRARLRTWAAVRTWDARLGPGRGGGSVVDAAGPGGLDVKRAPRPRGRYPPAHVRCRSARPRPRVWRGPGSGAPHTRPRPRPLPQPRRPPRSGWR